MSDDGGLLERTARRFVPTTTLEAGGLECRRAELTVQTVLVLIFWGPFFAVVYYYFFQSIFGALVTGGAAVTTGISLVLVRLTGRPSLAGNFMITTLFVAVVTLSAVNGGLRAPSLAWMALWPLFALLFAGRRSGWFWLVASLLSYVAFYLIETVGAGSPQWLEPWQLILIQLLGLTGLSIVSFAIVRSKEDLQGWLIGNLRDREADMRRARDKALEASEAKSTFLANVSHELRTPLNAIIGYSEMLKRDAESVDQAETLHETVPPGRLVEDLDRIKSAGDQLLALIDDVLDLSKIEAGQIETHFETIDMPVFFDELRSTLEPLAADNANELVIAPSDDLEQMRTDPQKLRQILLNLAGNACKFTNEGTVRLEASRLDSGGTVVFRVSDTGIGMSDEELARVFDAFSQADASTTREFGGTGLGLTIVDHFTELLDGVVEVDSTPGEGTTFTIYLPDEAVTEADVATTIPPEAGSRAADLRDVDEPKGDLRSFPSLDSTAELGGREEATRRDDEALILVIDDDPDVRDLLSRVLRREDFGVETAADAEEGLEKARRLRPTAITLDIKMPGTNGWELLSELADDPELSKIPVVLVTMVDDRSHGLAVEADHYLRKPVDRDKLLEILGGYRADQRAELLLVEDDESTREMMHRNLADDKWEIRQATNGSQALDVLDETTPTVILLDLMMPEMDGFEFLARIRLGNYPYIPVVVVTAKELTRRDRDILDREVVEIIKKGGYDREDLLEEVRTLVARAAG